MKRYKLTQRFFSTIYVIITILFLFAIIGLFHNLDNEPKSFQTETYVVQRGDTLWSIALQNNHTMKIQEYIDYLEKINNCTPNLQIGQELLIIK